MKIAIIGITGRMGKRIAAELLDRGHEVTGINRRPDRADAVIKDDRIIKKTADASDFNSIKKAISGDIEVVILATAPTREQPELFIEQNRNAIEACRVSGVKRLIALSNYISLKAPDGRDMMEAEPPHPAFYAVECVYDKAEALFRQEKELDWLLISPPAELVPYGKVSMKYRVAEDRLIVTDPDNHAYKETSVLSMEDLAFFIADEVEKHEYTRMHITLAY